MCTDRTESELIAVANDVLSEFSEDWTAGRYDFEESVIEDLGFACQILWETAGKPERKEWLPLFRMLFEGKGVAFSVLADQIPKVQADMKSERDALIKKMAPAVPDSGTQETDFDLF